MKENILIVEDEFIVANDLRHMLKKAEYDVCGIAASVIEAKAMVEKHKPSWVLLDIFLQDGSMGTELASFLNEKNIGFIYISANTNQSVLETAKATQPYGFLVKPFRERDLLIMLDIAREKHYQNIQFNLQKELILKKQLESIADAPIETLAKITRMAGAFQTLVPFDYMKLTMNKSSGFGKEETSFLRIGFDEYQVLKNLELPEIMGISSTEYNRLQVKRSGELPDSFFKGIEFRKALMDDPWEKLLSNHYALQSKLQISFSMDGGNTAFMMFYSRTADFYNNAHLNLLKKAEIDIEDLLSRVHRRPRNSEEPSVPKYENIIPKTTPDEKGNFDGIIGNSPSLLRVLDNISIVAPAPVSVLILGESGTGKERVAQCIHKLSNRKSKPIVTVNCAALPLELIESELFGHEKGAFTGASEKRIGKFELADGGTIFLDEIGELPMDAQVKLLRVLQEKEIEHVGGSKTIKIDVRIIAATNKKLEKEVADGRFRLDLYYRLNVFPIELPSLKERSGDIEVLANHFLKRYAGEMQKGAMSLSRNAIRQLESYNWPGNIRELEHLLERTILMCSGSVIDRIDLPGSVPEMQLKVSGRSEFKLQTLEEMETEHILGVLRNCNGKVCGQGGAADILGLPASTLNSKIKKLGIKKESYFNR